MIQSNGKLVKIQIGPPQPMKSTTSGRSNQQQVIAKAIEQKKIPAISFKESLLCVLFLNCKLRSLLDDYIPEEGDLGMVAFKKFLESFDGDASQNRLESCRCFLSALSLPPREDEEPSRFIRFFVNFIGRRIGSPFWNFFIGHSLITDAATTSIREVRFNQLMVPITASSHPIWLEYFVLQSIESGCSILELPSVLILQLVRCDRTPVKIPILMQLKYCYQVLAVLEMEEIEDDEFKYYSHVHLNGAWLTLNGSARFEKMDIAHPMTSENCYCVIFVRSGEFCGSEVPVECSSRLEADDVEQDQSTVVSTDDKVEHVVDRYLAQLKSDSVFIFNSRLLSLFIDKGYEVVRDWTRDLKIFSYDYLLFPLCAGDEMDPPCCYWVLIVVDLRGQTVMFYDPVEDGCLGASLLYSSKLVEYLSLEHADKPCSTGVFRPNELRCFDLTDPMYPRVESAANSGIFVSLFADCCVEQLGDVTFEGVRYNFGSESIDTARDLIYGTA